MLAVRGWTQARLSEETGIDRPALNRIIRTDTGISISTAQKIADAFGLSLGEMLSENLVKILRVTA